MNSLQLSAALQQAGFDIEAYVEVNRDLQIFGGDLSKIADHLLAHGLAEGRPLIFQKIEGFVSFMNAVAADQELGERRKIGRSVLNGWNVWQVHEKAADQKIWAHHGELADAFSCCGLRAICVVGDSHSQMFTGQAIRGLDIACIWALCSGGSARGLANSKSKSGYGQAINDKLITGPHPIVFHFGQVDIEFVYYYQMASIDDSRASLDGLEEFAIKSCDRYMEFIRATSQSNKVISAIFPPCLGDNFIYQGSINAHIAFLNSDIELEELGAKLRRLTFPSLSARTAMHYLMNAELARRAKCEGIPFVNSWSKMVDGSGLISDQLNLSGGYDHHLGIDPVAECLAPQVENLFAP